MTCRQDVWEEVASLKYARAGCAAGAAEGVLVVAGGDSESARERAFYRARTTLASVELYEPRADVWRAGPPLPHSRAEAGAALLWHPHATYAPHVAYYRSRRDFKAML